MSAAFRFLKKFEESEHEQGGNDNDHAQSRQVALMQTERAVTEDQVVLYPPVLESILVHCILYSLEFRVVFQNLPVMS